MSSEPIIFVEDVHKSYLMGKEAVPALRGVTMAIQPGEFVCLMGPSGSGKTTLLNIIGGLDEASRGHVIVDNENLVSMSEGKLASLRLQKMGFIFQNYNLLPNFSAQENVEAPMVLAKVSRKKRKERATKLMEKVGLGDRSHHYPSELSGGQQQRVAIARALANNPSILIADEMTGDLDSETGFAIMELASSLNDDGMTIVYVTHDPRMAKFAERVIELRDGKILDGDRAGLRSPALGDQGSAGLGSPALGDRGSAGLGSPALGDGDQAGLGSSSLGEGDQTEPGSPVLGDPT